MEIHRIYISPGHNFYGRHGKGAGDHPLKEVTEAECVKGKGIVGDRFFEYKGPDYKGQVTFFAYEDYENLCNEMNIYNKTPDVFRRNIITKNIPILDYIGKTFEIQGVAFDGTEEAKPCYWMNEAFGDGAEELLKGRGGLRAKVITSGVLKVSN